MGQIAVEFTGEERDLIRSLAKTQAQVGKLEGKLAGVQRRARQAGKEQKKTFGAEALGMLKKFIPAVSGAAGVLGAYKLVSAELRQIIKLQGEAAQKQITVAAARSDLVRNLVGFSEEQIRSVLKASAGIAGRTKVSEAHIARSLASAYSASGGDLGSAKGAVEMSAQLLRDKPAAIPGYAGSLLDLSKVTGTTDPTVNAGYLTWIAGASRVVEPRQQAMNIPRALLGMKAMGATARGAASAYAALTIGSGDITGAMSATGGIALAQQLREFLPGVGTMGGRIGRLQANRELARTFFGGGELGGRKWAGASFEKTMVGPIEQLLLAPQSKVARLYKANLQDFPSQRGLTELAEQTIRNLGVGPLQPTATIDRALLSAIEQIQLADLAGGQRGALRKHLLDVLQRSGQGALRSKVAELRWEAGALSGTRGPLDSAIEMLTSRAEQLRAPMAEVEFSRTGRIQGIARRDPTELEETQAGVLERLVNTLEELREATGAMTEAAQSTGGGRRYDLRPMTADDRE